MQSLISTEWLAAELDAPDLRIADATWFLPDDRRDARAEYEAAHIPGAVFLDLAELVDTATDLPNMLPLPEKFAERMTALGLGDGTRIVLYDNSPYHTAARVWVMLRSFGIRDIAILDGGFAKWRREGRGTAAGRAVPKPSHLTPLDHGADIVNLAAMKALVHGGEQIVDARSPARFAGDEPEPRPGVVPGHIPGSRNLPQSKLFEADGTWKRGDALREAFAAAGVDPAKPMVTTCGSGVTASVIAFGAHLLGGEARVYDGSWAEWGADPSTPKATGPA